MIRAARQSRQARTWTWLVIRHCDGSDRYLIARDGSSPCACGLTFDDEQCMVTWPHALIPPKPSLAELQELYELLTRAGMIKDERGQVTGRAAEHSIEDPFTGEITVRFLA